MAGPLVHESIHDGRDQEGGAVYELLLYIACDYIIRDVNSFGTTDNSPDAGTAHLLVPLRFTTLEID
jgi:hypothetical protein